MQLVEKKDNVERVYDVIVYNDKLTNLLDELVKNASYRCNGEFVENRDTKIDSINKKVDLFLPNGDNVYEDITGTRVKCEDRSPYEYYDAPYVIRGTKVVAPRLAYIIKGLIDNDDRCLDDMLNYKNNSELVSIDEQILLSDCKVDRIGNSKCDEKINALKELKDLYYRKENKQYFDIELLKCFYERACCFIELKLISEKTYKNVKPILLKDFK